MTDRHPLPAHPNHTTQKVSIVGFQVVLRSVHHDSDLDETCLQVEGNGLTSETVALDEIHPQSPAHV